MNLTFETGRAQSELFAFQCSQWVPIRNNQIIGRYKEMSPGESYSQSELIWNSQLIGRYKKKVTRWILWSMRAHLKQSTNRKILKKCHQVNLTFETARAQSELFTFQCGQWELIWKSQLIGRYKEMSPGESYGQLDLIWNSKLIGRYKEMSPGEILCLRLAELRVNSLLFNVASESSFETVN